MYVGSVFHKAEKVTSFEYYNILTNHEVIELNFLIMHKQKGLIYFTYPEIKKKNYISCNF